MDSHTFNESELEIHSPGDSRATTLERLSPSKAQGQGDSSLRTPRSDNNKLNLYNLVVVYTIGSMAGLRHWFLSKG
jgi:hypothetical protein